MCGIAGIITTRSWDEELKASLTQMQAALRHRGPDDQGLWVDPVGGVGLAHARLAILDLSPAGHQPMSTPDGRFNIVFNGEIYNFHSLRKELESEGVHFQSHSDTEVLLRLFEKSGPAMLNRLRGMFAFCIWDKQTRSAFLARDPMGIKPLYYSVQSNRLTFASELQAIRNSGLVSSQLDGHAITEYLETGSVPEPLTLLAEVRCLEAGHCLTWHESRVTSTSYWQLHFSEASATSDAVQITRDALLDSMEAHFISDVPVGIFLSGGIDSTAVLALARHLGKTDLQTFSIGVDDPALDESLIARRTAEHFGAHHHEKRLDPTSGQTLFHEFLLHTDQPSVDGFNSFTVSSFARAQGLKVVLSGLGGDELFGGYPSFSKVPQIAIWLRRLQKVPGLTQVLGRGLQGLSPQASLQRLGALMQSPISPESVWRAFRGIMTPRQTTGVLERLGIPQVPHAEARAGSDTQSWPESADAWKNRVSLLEVTRYMRNQLLRDSDVMSMAHGLELRVPLVDRVLMEEVAKLPASQRLMAGKQALLDAVPEIPAWVINQRKRGFTFPFQRWLEADWGKPLAQSDQLLPIKNPTWYQRWTVFMLWTWLEGGKGRF